jgi:primosomal protein N' (replication factor Y)
VLASTAQAKLQSMNPTGDLFPEAPAPHDEYAAPAAPQVGPFAGVAIEQSIDRVLDYSIPKKLQAVLKPGQRVRVPLGRGNRAAYGYVVRVTDTTEHPKTKPLAGIEDDRVLAQPMMLELARWISRYYVSPLGMVLETIIPSAVKKRIGLGYTQQVTAAKPKEELQAILEATKNAKRRTALARLLQVEEGDSIELQTLAFEAGTTRQLIKKLAQAGLLRITEHADLGTLAVDAPSQVIPAPHAPNAEQQQAIDAIRARLDSGFSSNLLYGVTGSGKTEVYLRCIETVVNAGRQAIVLVPEIALTPQTVRRFVERFPRISVLHSAMTATARHQSWQQISTGRAQVIVGARSAIFAPTRNLGLIVVDEEHEPSYKQDQVPRYHARDVAIKRAQIEGIPVLLGSATPSLETWQRLAVDTPPAAAPFQIAAPVPPPPAETRQGRPDAGTQSIAQGNATADRATGPDGSAEIASLRPPPPPSLPGEGRNQVENGGDAMTPSPAAAPQPKHLLRLPSRVRGLALPKVELIDLKQVNRLRKGVHLLSQRLEFLLKQTLDAGEQAILLLNRRGYANFIHCAHCNEAVQCKYCDATMTFHRTPDLKPAARTTDAQQHVGQMHCHYCLAVNPLPVECPTCAKKLSLFGLGTQRVEEELARKFPGVAYARADSDTMRSRTDYETLLHDFGTGKIKVLLGTQMIAKGLDYPNVTLVGVISGDTALALPDFRAAERTFQLITQVAGRAGRGDKPGRVIVQTFLGHDPALSLALRHDYEGFAAQELANRTAANLPPLNRMVRVVVRDQSLEDLHRRAEDLAGALMTAIEQQSIDVELRGPMPCAIERIANYHRAQIVLTSPTPGPLQRVLATLRRDRGLVSNDRVAIDVDPVSML